MEIKNEELKNLNLGNTIEDVIKKLEEPGFIISVECINDSSENFNFGKVLFSDSSKILFASSIKVVDHGIENIYEFQDKEFLEKFEQALIEVYNFKRNLDMSIFVDRKNQRDFVMSGLLLRQSTLMNKELRNYGFENLREIRKYIEGLGYKLGINTKTGNLVLYSSENKEVFTSTNSVFTKLQLEDNRTILDTDIPEKLEDSLLEIVKYVKKLDSDVYSSVVKLTSVMKLIDVRRKNREEEESNEN